MGRLGGKLKEAYEKGIRAKTALHFSIQKIFPTDIERQRIVSETKPETLPKLLVFYEGFRELVIHILRQRIESRFKTLEDEEGELSRLPDLSDDDSDTEIINKSESRWSRLLDRVKLEEIVGEWVQGPYQKLISSVKSAEVVKRAEEYAVSHFRCLYISRLKKRMKERRKSKHK